jgi:orotate phosphoribosyltransferase
MESPALDLLLKTKAILPEGHYVGTSGRHMPVYINKDALYPHTKETSKMGELFAEANFDLDPDVVVAPALGGIILSTWTAYHLSQIKTHEILGVYTEKSPEDGQIFTRGYGNLVAGKDVLVIEDLTTTGGSVKKTIAAVRDAGGTVIRVCVMVNRDPARVNEQSIGVPFKSLAVLEVPSYKAADCPLCEKGIPINTEVGHGKKFLASR